MSSLIVPFGRQIGPPLARQPLGFGLAPPRDLLVVAAQQYRRYIHSAIAWRNGCTGGIVHPFRDSLAAAYSSAATAGRRSVSPSPQIRDPRALPGAAAPPHPGRTAPRAPRPTARSLRPTAPPPPARLPPAGPRPCNARTAGSAAGPLRTARRRGGRTAGRG